MCMYTHRYGASQVAQRVKNLPAVQEKQKAQVEVSIPRLRRSPGKGMATVAVFLPGESHGQRSLVGSSPWGCKESDMTEQLTLSFFLPVQGRTPSFPKLTTTACSLCVTCHTAGPVAQGSSGPPGGCPRSAPALWGSLQIDHQSLHTSFCPEPNQHLSSHSGKLYC